MFARWLTFMTAEGVKNKVREGEKEGKRQTKTTCQRDIIAYSMKRTNPRYPFTQKADSLKPSRAV